MAIKCRSLPSWRALLLLWLPSLLAVLAVLSPIAYLFFRASSGDISTWSYVLRPETFKILFRTILLGVSVTVLSILIALPLAWLTLRTNLPLRNLWAILTPLPLVIPSYVGAYLFASAFGPRGLLQGFLEDLIGITRLPDIYGFPGALMVLTLLNYPFILLLMRARLMRMDPSLEEAARSLGENNWGTFWRVTFPQLRPAITSGSLLVLLYVLRDFGAVSIMRFNTFTRVIYIQYQNSFDRVSAAALALVLVFVSLIILFSESRGSGKNAIAQPPRISKQPGIIDLGSWRWPAFIFCFLIISVALLIPASVLLYWLFRALAQSANLNVLLAASINSISASAIAALIAISFAIPIAILDIRRSSRLTRIVERSTYIAFALPGIVIALALVFFGANFAPFLYQTIPILLLAYLVLFLPEAVGAVRNSLMQVHPNIEEAGRSLGKRPIEVFRRITYPLLRPGLTTGAVLVFLTSMKELPATLILAPTGFKTLSTSIWSAVSEAYFAQAALPALLLILISSIPSAIILHRGWRER